MSDDYSKPIGEPTPVPLSVFLKTVHGTHDEVWGHLLTRNLGSAKRTPAQWREEIVKLKKS